jgi:hypothetical protein
MQEPFLDTLSMRSGASERRISRLTENFIFGISTVFSRVFSFFETLVALITIFLGLEADVQERQQKFSRRFSIELNFEIFPERLVPKQVISIEHLLH